MNALTTTLKQLRISGLIQTLDVRLQEAAANRLSHAEFLELICQDELNVRQQRQMERHTKLADCCATRYQSGLDIYFDVIAAQTALLNNQRTALNLQMEQLTASVQLIKALGGGWDVMQGTNTIIP